MAMPILVALVTNTSATSAAQMNTAVPGPHENGTLCICRPNRTLWYWAGGPSGTWGRVTL